jgi:hypothetical protein
VQVYYNRAIDSLIFFDFDRSVTFDLKNDLVFDENDILLSPGAVHRSDTVFVPVKLLCDHFGWYYSYIQTSIAPVIRINSSQPASSDEDVVSTNSARMKVLYAQYTASSTSATSSTSSTATRTTSTTTSTTGTTATRTSTSTETSASESTTETTLTSSTREKEIISVYLLFDGVGEQLAEALTYLYSRGVSAAVFVTADEITENKDVLRQIFVQGHVVGLKITGDEDAQDQLERAQRAFANVLFSSVRSIMPEDAEQDMSEFEKKGYKIWTPTVDPYAANGSAWSSAYLTVSTSVSSECVRIVCGSDCLFTVMRLESMSAVGGYRLRSPFLWADPAQ